MTSIKPPKGPSPTLPTEGPGKSKDADKAGGAKFSESLAAGKTEASQTSKVDATAAQSITNEVQTQLKAGQINGTEAVNKLIESVMDSDLASNLNDKGRADLETFLRTLSVDDPNLSRLIGQLDKD